MKALYLDDSVTTCESAPHYPSPAIPVSNVIQYQEDWPGPPYPLNPMATYEVQVLTPHGWFADPDYLGGDDDDNKWPTEAAAQAAVDELVALAGFDRAELRVALV